MMLLGARSHGIATREAEAPGRPALALVGETLQECTIADFHDSHALIIGLPALEAGQPLVIAESVLGLMAVTVLGPGEGGFRVRAGVSAEERDGLIAKIGRLLSGLS